MGRRVSWWWATSVGAAALALGLGLLAALWLLSRPIALLILGATIAEALSPVVVWLERRMPRLVAIIVVYVTLALLLAGVGAIALPTLIGQARAAASRLPDLIASLVHRIEGTGLVPGGKISGALSSQSGRLSSVAVTMPFRALSSLVEVVLVYFISVYWLIGAPAMRGFMLSFFPEDRHARAQDLMKKTGSAMGGYVRGAAINGMILGAMFYVGLLLIRVPYTAVLALLAAVLEVVPVLGPIIAGAVMVGVALVQSPTQALIVLAFVVVLQQLETHILVPNIMRSQTDIPSLFAVLALFAGATLGGLLGVLISIPTAAAFRVLLIEVIAPALRRRIGAPAA